MSLELQKNLKQTQALSPSVIQGLNLLVKSLPDLRAEIVAEIERNPALEDVDHPLERQLSEVERENRTQDDEPDYPADDFTPGLNRDEDAAERRQAFFDNQVRAETLQEHLLAQLELSDVPEADYQLVEMLVGELDDDGYFRGSIPDLQMAFSCSESHILGTLDILRTFDPPGCGARDVRECLLAQLDSIGDVIVRATVRKMIDCHLEDIGAGRFAAVMASLGLDRAGYTAALKALRTLDGRPGRQYPSARERVEYVNPEIHARKIDGRWTAVMDQRSLPTIRFSQKFADLLKDPAQTAETKAYVRERISAAKAFCEAVRKRQETVQSIADEIFDRQQEFFEQGFRALKPMTELEIAAKVGVHGATVSRTVRDKYAETPQGTIELRRFFATGVRTASGEELSQQAALDALQKIVSGEDKRHPLSDARLADEMKAMGFPVARRTIVKYREKLSIPAAPKRRLR